MTYTQFLTALRNVPKKWHLVGRNIRTTEGFCPLGVLLDPYLQVYTPEDWYASDKLGLKLLTATRIYRAADGITNNQTRLDLLRACGLKERE